MRNQILTIFFFGSLMLAACESKEAKDVVSTDADAGTTVVSDGGGDVALVTGPQACEELAKECLAGQQGCALDESGAPTCVACEKGYYPELPNGLCAQIPGTPVSHRFIEMTIKAGKERPGDCQTWELNNEEELWVNAVHFKNEGSIHHSNWTFVPQDFDKYPTGLWKNCYQNGFAEAEAAAEGGVVFAQSTQVKEETQKFGPGIAYRIPPHSKIVGSIHLLNYLPEDVTTNIEMTLYTIEKEDVVTHLKPMVLTNRALNIPANSEARFQSDCNFMTMYSGLFDGPLELKVHYLLPHYHNTATGFALSILGGENDGDVVFETSGYSEEPFGVVFDPPLDFSGSLGMSYYCHYKNPFNKNLGWGIGDDEMCDMLGFVESPAGYIGYISSGEGAYQQDGVYVHDGVCAALALDFDGKDE